MDINRIKELAGVGKITTTTKKTVVVPVVTEVADRWGAKDEDSEEQEKIVLGRLYRNLLQGISDLTNIKGGDVDDETEAKHEIARLLHEFIEREL